MPDQPRLTTCTKCQPGCVHLLAACISAGGQADQAFQRCSRISALPRVSENAVIQEGMWQSHTAVRNLSDQELLAEVKIAATHERAATVRLVALLAQLDERRLYLGEGCSSLFTYCTRILRLSEHAAYGRIEAARAARKYPVVLELLADGSLTLTAVTLVAPHLTPAKHLDVLNEARDKSKREVEHLVARLRPLPAVAATMRKLPVPRPVVNPSLPPVPVVDPAVNDESPVRLSPPARAAIVKPLAPERYKVQFTISAETHDKLRRAQDLLRHSIPNGDPAAIFDRALTMLLGDLEQAEIAATARPRTARPTAAGSRYVSGGCKARCLEARRRSVRVRRHSGALR